MMPRWLPWWCLFWGSYAATLCGYHLGQGQTGFALFHGICAGTHAVIGAASRL